MLVSSPMYQENFLSVAQFDNVECITLKLSTTWWEYAEMFEIDFCKYCTKRCIEYCLFRERGNGNNLHYHGIMGFPYAHIRKRFLSWFNKYFGKLHSSEKGNLEGWYNYCTKDYQFPVQYLFDPIYEPVKV